MTLDLHLEGCLLRYAQAYDSQGRVVMVASEARVNPASLRARIPNIQSAVKAAGLRAATISDLANRQTHQDVWHLGTLRR